MSCSSDYQTTGWNPLKAWSGSNRVVVPSCPRLSAWTRVQGKPKRAGIELSRFVINSTVGLGGLFDIASLGLNLEVKDNEDMGQALGSFGFGHGFCFILPFLGPRSLRDTVGLAGDFAPQSARF